MNSPIEIERVYNAPIGLVWQAISNNDQMKKWYFDLPEFKPEIGFEFSFMGGTEEHSYLHLCKLTEVEQEKKLTYSWQYDGYEGISFVTFELFNEGEKTRLKLTHKGLDTFPKHNKDFAKENFIQGWTDILETSLKNYLENVNEIPTT